MITKDLILEGTKFRKKVKVSVYDEEIEVRPLTDVEIAKIFKTVEDSGYDTSDPKVSDNFILQVEACRYGIVDKALHEIANQEDPKTDQKEVLELMVGNAIIEIGQAIISISTVGNEELNDLFRKVKARV